MENKAHALAAGLFALVVLGMLAGLAAWLTRDQGDYVAYELTTTQAVTGLQPQAAVRYRGVAVGRVESIGFDPDLPGTILIDILVDAAAPITRSTYASLGYQGITGLAHVDLDDARQALPDPGLSPRGRQRLPMRPSSLSQLAAMGPEMMADIRATLARVNTLLSDSNQQVLIDSIANIGEAAQRSASLIQNLERDWTQHVRPALATLGSESGETLQALRQAAASLAQLSQEARNTVRRINEPGGAAAQFADSAEAFSGIAREIRSNTLPRIERALGQIEGTMQSIDSVARDIGDNPQALIYGPNNTEPGPGEPGHVPPAANP